MNTDVIAKINEALPEYEYRDQQELKKLAKEYEVAKAITEFRNHLVIDDFCQRLQADIDSCNNQLSENETLDDKTRQKLFIKKSVYKEFLDIFNGATETVKVIEDQIPQL